MDSVTWTSALTAEDVRTGIRMRLRSRPGGRFVSMLARARRGIVIALAVAAGLVGILFVIDADDRASHLVVLLLVVGLIGLLALVTRVERRLYRGIAEAFGENDVTVDESGVHLRGPRGTTDTVWSAYGRWAETPETFVLLSSDPASAILTVLPKRGLEAEGVEHLRALIARHATAGPLAT